MGVRARRFAVWSCTLAGGACVGAGLFLQAQVHFARYVRDEVRDIGFLRRFVGRATFLWRDKSEKLSLALAELPEEALEHSSSLSWVLLVLGFPILTPLLSGWLRRRGRKR